MKFKYSTTFISRGLSVLPRVSVSRGLSKSQQFMVKLKYFWNYFYVHMTRMSQWSRMVLPGIFLLKALQDNLLLLSFSPGKFNAPSVNIEIDWEKSWRRTNTGRLISHFWDNTRRIQVETLLLNIFHIQKFKYLRQIETPFVYKNTKSKWYLAGSWEYSWSSPLLDCAVNTEKIL